jgi:Ca-activated chloride channel homolog
MTAVNELPKPRFRLGMAGVLFVWVLVFAGLVAYLSGQEPPVIRAGVDLVRLDIVVTDRRGVIVSGLTADDFEVVENRKRQTISVFASDGDEKSPDLHVGVLLDLSASMASLFPLLRDTTLEVLNRLPEAIDYTLIEVGNDARTSRFTRGDFDALVERVRRLRRNESASTALWDGVRSYLVEAADRPGRHVLVAFTDGSDTASMATFEQVVRAVRGSGVTVFAVDFSGVKSSTQALRLRRISDQTGGLTMFPYGRKQIDEVHRRIVSEVRSRYSLGYVSTNPAQDGRWREVKIRLVRPEHRDLDVRAKEGYYAAKSRP